MVKTRRGRVLWKLPKRARGICPLCQRTGVKLLYPAVNADGNAISVCKHCRAKQTH